MSGKWWIDSLCRLTTDRLMCGGEFAAPWRGLSGEIGYVSPDLPPPGIETEAVRLHLQDIQTNVLIVSPNARTDVLEVLSAG